MPSARRIRKGQTGRRPSAQIRNAQSVQGGGGPDRYDGRLNPRATKLPEPTPFYKGPGRVVATH